MNQKQYFLVAGLRHCFTGRADDVENRGIASPLNQPQATQVVPQRDPSVAKNFGESFFAHSQG